MPQDIRKSIIAGSWYPGRAETLRSQIQAFFKNVPETQGLSGELIALIAPHAGYAYSGEVAAHAYKLLLTRPFSQVVLVAPSHRYPFRGASIDQKGGYETPLGIIPVDHALARAISGKSSVFHLCSGRTSSRTFAGNPTSFFTGDPEELFYRAHYSRLPGWRHL